ncbi:MAG: TraV family lipoprotein [Succinivibrionaceae bacterium]|nr:TraV family lipoprotein [Succinivibrionaceae bacterium]MEE1339205.1 TraV family lipoprotein [Succinivibrionaceae bacterium]
MKRSQVFISLFTLTILNQSLTIGCSALGIGSDEYSCSGIPNGVTCKSARTVLESKDKGNFIVNQENRAKYQEVSAQNNNLKKVNQSNNSNLININQNKNNDLINVNQSNNSDLININQNNNENHNQKIAEKSGENLDKSLEQNEAKSLSNPPKDLNNKESITSISLENSLPNNPLKLTRKPSDIAILIINSYVDTEGFIHDIHPLFIDIENSTWQKGNYRFKNKNLKLNQEKSIIPYK